MGLDEEKALLGSTVVLEKVKKVSKYSPFIKNDKYLTKRGIQRLFKRGYPTTTVAWRGVIKDWSWTDSYNLLDLPHVVRKWYEAML